jgi:flagellar biosynthesis/type III secretory pathway chaperone
MSASIDQKALEALFQNKIMLYYDLRECLKNEQAYLIQLDLNRLWEVSRTKESLCAELTALRNEIMALVHRSETDTFPNLNDLMALLPQEGKTVFQGLCYRLTELRSEVEALRKENMHYVNDSLQFIDEIIAIISGAAQNREIYDRRCQLKKGTNPLLLRREV